MIAKAEVGGPASLGTASIIICTRNRSESLSQTLRALVDVVKLSPISVEVLIVDNGSTDNTLEVAETWTHSGVDVHCYSEPKPGQARARNCGLREAKGNIIIFTDDDVRPEPRWLDELVAPIISGRADGVVGRVVLAPHLEKPWLTPMHRSWLACTDEIDSERPMRMVGANMAFSRDILTKVCGFDEELGPGALGFGDDSLFSVQLQRAGYRLAYAHEACVVHHCEESRLAPGGLRSSAIKMGQSAAYVAHHWHHTTVTNLFLRSLRKTVQAKLAELTQKGESLRSSDNLQMLRQAAYLRALQAYRRVPCKYTFEGLQKTTQESDNKYCTEDWNSPSRAGPSERNLHLSVHDLVGQNTSPVPEVLPQVKSQPGTQNGVVFILGCEMRSGTNFLNDLVSLHPACIGTTMFKEDFALLDLELLYKYNDIRMQYYRSFNEFAENRAGSHFAENIFNRTFGDGIIANLRTQMPKGSDEKMLVTKSPTFENLNYAPVFFPCSRFILLLRDGRSVVYSMQKSFDANFFVCLDKWKAAIAWFHRFKSVQSEFFSKNCLTVKYEDIFLKPLEELRRIASFLELDPSAVTTEMVSGLKVRGSSDLRDSNDSIHWKEVAKTNGFNPLNRFLQWPAWKRRYCEAYLGDSLSSLGYPIKARRSPDLRFYLIRMLHILVWLSTRLSKRTLKNVLRTRMMRSCQSHQSSHT